MFANLIPRTFQRLRVHFYELLSNNRRIVGHPLAAQPVLYLGDGRIVFDGTVYLGYFPSPFFYSSYIHLEARRPSAEIFFGDNVRANNGLVVICEKAVTIGSDALLGTNVEISDSDFHGVDPATRRGNRHAVAAVTVGCNVWIGSNVRILKGSTIGDNSVIGAGSIVTGEIPANVVAVGAPAKPIRSVYD